MRRSSETLASTQRTLSFADPTARERRGEHLESWMLQEDIHTQIMPWRPEEAGWQVTLRSGNKDMARRVAEGLSPGESAWDLADSLCDFVREITSDLVRYGRAVRELVLYLDESDRPVTFELTRVPPTSVVQTPIGWYQIIPAEVSRLRQQQRVVRLDPKLMFVFAAPTHAARIRPILRRLGRVPRVGAQIPFGSHDETAQFYRAYEFSTQAHAHDEAVAVVTREMGWDGRGSLSRPISEWYMMLKYVRFQEFKLGIRDAILGELDHALVTASERLGTDVRLSVESPVTAEVIRECYTALEEGTRTFNEVFKTLSFI